MGRSTAARIPAWPWQKGPVKRSLVERGQAGTARPWILSLVQAAHWLVFPGLALVAWQIFAGSDALALLLGSRWQVFALLLSPAVTALGALAPMLMHAREGWQVAPAADEAAVGNDALLRLHAYRFLFSGLTAAQLLFALGVFGAGGPVLALLLPAALVVLLGPARPLLPWRQAGALLLPLPVPLGLAFVVSGLLRAAALLVLCGPALAAGGLPPLLALAPLLGAGMGGGLEGGLAETRFNQWWHLLAVLLMNAGVLLEVLLLRLVTA